MKPFKQLGGALGVAAVFASTACGDLEVTNPNNPGIDRVLATPGDVANLAYGTLNSYYLTHTNPEGPIALAVTADVLTANFGNFGMRFNNLEPRAEYVNSSAGSDRAVTEVQWDGYYGALGAANDALWAMQYGGIEMDGGQEEADKVTAVAKFAQAATLTQLALMFDQGFVVDEDSVQASVEDLTFAVQLMPYTGVAAAARAKWDEVIALTASPTFQFGSEASQVFQITGAPLTVGLFHKWANTMAARLLAYTPRTGAENAATDWNAVLAYAENGLTDRSGAGTSIIVDGDATNWYSEMVMYGNLPSWLRVDHRIVNMMAPNVPPKFDGTVVTPVPVDARYSVTDSTADFYFDGGVIGDPLRGIYMQSATSHRRYYLHSWDAPNPGVAPAPFVTATENNLLIAEALIRTGGDLNAAAALINLTRVDRGGLTPATAADGADVLLDYLLYERRLELVNTSAVELWDGRRFEDLQEGTFRHLPIPARELETLGLGIYTFGGVGGPDMRIQNRVAGLSLSWRRGHGLGGPASPQR